MRYKGGKGLEKKHFLPGLLRLIERINAEAYYEPFVGAGSVIEDIPNTIERIGSDKHFYIIEFLRAIRDGWRPEYIADEEQRRARWELAKKYKGQKMNPAEVAFWGFGMSYGGKYFGGFLKDTDRRSYYENALNSIERQAPKLKGCRFYWGNYHERLPELIGRPLIVYSDPPYRGAEKVNFKFNSDNFWKWVRYRVVGDIFHLISENSAPPDFEPVLEYQKQNRMSWQKGSFYKPEYLFAHKSQAAFIREAFNDA